VLMFIKRCDRKVNGKAYQHYLLVQTVRTEKGPRHKVVCSLGNVEPGPPETWHELSKKLEDALSGQLQLPVNANSELVSKIMQKINGKSAVKQPAKTAADAGTPEDDIWVTVKPNEMTVENARLAGPVHVGHQMWLRLELDDILKQAGLSKKACHLAEVLTLNRLVEPCSDHATPDWLKRTMLPDILGNDLSDLDYRKFYGSLDALHPRREAIETGLFNRENNLFNLDTSLYLYDLTSTYFEGRSELNPKARFGYSRDKRSDCKQVLVGLVLNRDGFARAHEVFEGNRVDSNTVKEMLEALSARSGQKKGATVIVDRGMSGAENLATIKKAGHYYLVAAKQSERAEWLEELEDEQGWKEIIRQPSVNNRSQQKSNVKVKLFKRADEVLILCKSDARTARDKQIREEHEKKLLADLKKLARKVDKEKNEKRAYESIERLKERYPRVARYYEIAFQQGTLVYCEDKNRKKKAEQADGSYIIKTNRQDLTEEEIWKTYVLLTRVEAAFRDLKQALAVRPIYHRLEHRVEAHIFTAILAYHLLVLIEKTLQENGITESWETLRKQLSTHQVVTVKLPEKAGRALSVITDTKLTEEQKLIYGALKIPQKVYSSPKKIWQ
jgi:transposase